MRGVELIEIVRDLQEGGGFRDGRPRTGLGAAPLRGTSELRMSDPRWARRARGGGRCTSAMSQAKGVARVEGRS